MILQNKATNKNAILILKKINCFSYKTGNCSEEKKKSSFYHTQKCNKNQQLKKWLLYKISLFPPQLYFLMFLQMQLKQKKHLHILCSQEL